MVFSILSSASDRISRFSIRGKALLITASVLLTLVVLGGVGVDVLIRRSFKVLENNWIRENAHRVQQLIAVETDGIRRTTYDYAVWSDTFNFTRDLNRAYIKSNFNLDVFKNLQLYGAFIYSTKGIRLTGFTMKPDQSDIEESSPDWDNLLGRFAREVSQGNNKALSGLIEFNGKVFFISCHQVLRDSESILPGGCFIHLRMLNEDLLDRISGIAGLKIFIIESVSESEKKDYKYDSVDDFYFKEISADKVQLVIPFRDMDGKEVIAGATYLERKIGREERRARYLFYILLSVIVAVSGFLNQFMFKKLVIFRLEKMMAGVKDVGETLDLSKRLDMPENDELDELAGGINRMLDSLEEEKRRHEQAEVEKELMQEYMLQAKKMEALGTMAGGIAHDFNNMLVIILGSAELLRTDLPPGHPVLEHVDSIEKAGQNASALVRRMMTINKGYSAPKMYFSVGSAISEMLSLIKANLPGTISLKLNNKISDDLIYADIAQFQQVIINLVTNAAHAMAGRKMGNLDISIGEVILPADDYRLETVSLSAGRYVRIDISDNGNGIPSDIRERIFEPFFSTKPVGSGTGLGLAVVHGFVVNNGGSIGVESEPGNGTQFIIHMPSVVEKRKPAVHADGEHINILVVDDDSLVRKTLVSGLKRYGYKISEASSGHSALKILEENGDTIKLVVTDQMMPGMSGHELGSRIASIRPGLPIILISGYLSGIDDSSIGGANFVKIMMKPVAIADLDSVICETLQKKRLEQSI